MLKFRVNRRAVQIVLGLLWILDGALQLQHQMFTANLANDVIAPAAQGQPFFVSSVIHFFIRIFLLHPAVFNSVITVVQLGLGGLILWKQTARIGLISSAAWAIFVWYVGEGLGGIASGHSLLLMGAPGAALIYAILALGVLPQKKDRRPAYWLALIWAILWIGGAIFQLLPGQNTVASVSSMMSGNASGAPGWLASLDIHTANVVGGIGGQNRAISAMHMIGGQAYHMKMSQPPSGHWFILLLAAIQLLIGAVVLLPGYFRRIAISAGIILSLGFWFVGQDLGAYYSGLATDPSTAPLFILLGIAVLGSPDFNITMLRQQGRTNKNRQPRKA